MKIRKIGAAALAAALMAGTAVTASAEGPTILYGDGEDEFPVFLIEDLALSMTPATSHFGISPVEEKKESYVDVVISETISKKLVDFNLAKPEIKSVSFVIRDFHDCPNLKTMTILTREHLRFDEKAFSNCPNLTDIYFAGTEEEWDSAMNGKSREEIGLENVTVHFESTGPDNSGNNNTSNTDNGNTSSTGNTSNTNTNNTDKENNSDTGVPGIAFVIGAAALAGAGVIIARKKK